MSVFLYYFGLPHGQIWPNLLASLVCVGVAWWRLRARMIAHHLEQMRQHERRHEDLKAHITATAVAVRQPPKRLVPRPGPEEEPR